jgi:hypothetical protein
MVMLSHRFFSMLCDSVHRCKISNKRLSYVADKGHLRVVWMLICEDREGGANKVMSDMRYIWSEIGSPLRISVLKKIEDLEDVLSNARASLVFALWLF